jgi:hypothetical protein
LAGAKAEFLMVACEGQTYILYVEAEGKSERELRTWGENLETALQRNAHYRYCRELGQLDPVRVFHITRGGQTRYLAARQARGRQLGNVKPTIMDHEGGWLDVFEGRLVTVFTTVSPINSLPVTRIH